MQPFAINERHEGSILGLIDPLENIHAITGALI